MGHRHPMQGTICRTSSSRCPAISSYPPACHRVSVVLTQKTRKQTLRLIGIYMAHELLILIIDLVIDGIFKTVSQTQPPPWSTKISKQT